MTQIESATCVRGYEPRIVPAFCWDEFRLHRPAISSMDENFEMEEKREASMQELQLKSPNGFMYIYFEGYK
jgi:hypothetical protein